MPNRKSDHRKKLEGTYRPDRARRGAFEPLTRTPQPPADLDEDAAELWRAIGKECIQRRTLTAGDLHALGEAARAGAFVRRIHRDLAGVDLVTAGPRGEDRVHPLASEARRWTSEFRSWLKVLGLTPSARTSVEALAPPAQSAAEDELDRLTGLRAIR